MSGVRGSFTQLRALREKIAGLPSDIVKGELAQVLSGTALKLIADEFKYGVDPYGRKWKPVKRGGQPLIKTGRLRASFSARPAPGGISIDTTVAYAAVHQNGADVAPHSRLQGGTIWSHPETGRILSKAQAKRRTLVVEHKFSHKTYGSGFKITRRMFIPTGTLGAIWRNAFRRDSLSFFRRYFKKSGGEGGAE